MTFSVTGSTLDIAVPAGPVTLGSASPGNPIGPTPLGLTTVTDGRAGTADWTASANASGGFTGNQTPTPAIIPASQVAFDPGTPTVVSGTVTPTGVPITLSDTDQSVVTTTGVSGNNTVTWNPALTVNVPANAIAGAYTGTITQSVA